MERLQRGLNHSLGWMFSLIIISVPLALWGTYSQLADPSTLRGALTLGAKICAFAGFAGFAWSLILGTRLRVIESLFGGLDKVYLAHRIIGGTSVILVLMHPIFLSARSIAGNRSLLNLWNPLSADFYLAMGIVGFLVAAIVTIITYWVKVKHQTFIQIHRFFGWVIIPFMLHTFLSHGAIASNGPLRRYMLILSILGVIAFFYHSIFGAWLVRKYRYKVMAVKQFGDAVELDLKPRLRPMAFTPGQFAYVTLKDDDLDSESHPYSFSSSNRERLVKFVVKNLGDYTANLSKVDVGDEAYLRGPHGSFSYLNTKNKKQVWIAGGIGVSPFLSMARSLRKNSAYDIEMFYCTKTHSEQVFFNDLNKIAKKHKRFNLRGICEDEQGFLTAERIQAIVPDLNERDVFICGPPIMMQSLQQQLIEKGLLGDQIHFEQFSY